jgi:hypothetical protein
MLDPPYFNPGQGLATNRFAITHYVVAYKTIHMYYLKKSHDSLKT